MAAPDSLTAPHTGPGPSMELTHLAEVLPEGIDLRLVVTDMDGTLLDGEGQLPVDLAALVARLREAGVLFCPASGRQMANLKEVFAGILDEEPFIAENGTFALAGERELYRLTMPRQEAVGVIETVRRLYADGMDVGAVVATPYCAWVERSDAAFLAQVDTYYSSRRCVENLTDLPLDDVLKVAVYDFVDSECLSAPPLAAASPKLQTVVSGKHWTDLMPPEANKGLALHKVQEILGITPAQTAVFGDYLNDLEMLGQAELSFAMANAHPSILEAAHYTAPANTEAGVLRTVELLLER